MVQQTLKSSQAYDPLSLLKGHLSIFNLMLFLHPKIILGYQNLTEAPSKYIKPEVRYRRGCLIVLVLFSCLCHSVQQTLSKLDPIEK